jgi:polar amino acid transport system substrate-binding protein
MQETVDRATTLPPGCSGGLKVRKRATAPLARHARRALAGLVVLVPILAASTGDGQEQRTIRVAVEGAYPPFNYFDQNNELQGFEIDLLKAICARMQARCIPVAHEWDGIIRGLIDRKYDAIMSSLEITEKRAKRIAFSRPYYRIPAAFIGPKDEPVEPIGREALAGKTIGTVHDSEHVAYLAKLAPDAEIETYGKLDEANLDLLTGRVDLVLGDKLALSKFLTSREGACCRFVADAPYDPAYHGQGYGVGLRKEDPDLKAAFEAAIGHVIADGTYDRIRAAYFPFDIK